MTDSQGKQKPAQRTPRPYVQGYAPAVIREDVKQKVRDFMAQRGFAGEQNMERCVLTVLLDTALESPSFLNEISNDMLKKAVLQDFDLLAKTSSHNGVPTGTDRQ
jgi:hypothetical protein